MMISCIISSTMSWFRFVCLICASLIWIWLVIAAAAAIDVAQGGLSCYEGEMEALIDLMQQASCAPAYSSAASSWKAARLNNTPCCEWEGLECDKEWGRIISIRLPIAQPASYHPPYCGTLPPSLGHLHSLQTLDLQGGCFTGSLPSELASLVNLTYLDLSNNQLQTAFPISGFRNLRHLNLSMQNYLQGDILSAIVLLHQLEYLDLSSSVLHPGSRLPDNWGSSNPPRLRILDLHNCDLNGLLPPSLGSLEDLEYLDLSENKGLEGEVPWQLGNLKNLKYLSLNLRSSEDSVLSWGPRSPNDNCQWSAITSLHLQNVKLTSSSTPFCFESLSANLTSLDLSKTGISDPVALTFLSKTSNLKALSLATNFLPEFPVWLRQLRLLETLDVSHNPLRSGIPEWIVELPALRSLFASFATLNGTLPSVMFNMSHLEAVDLSHNSFSGPLPGEWIAKLRFVDLSWNMLEGSVTDNVNWSSIQYIDLSHNKLGGALPGNIGNMTHVRHLDLSGNQFTGCIPSAIGHLIHLGEEFAMEEPLNGLSDLHFGQLNVGLNVSDNMLECPIPDSLGKLSHLKSLSFSKNSLNESLPLSLNNLTELLLLDVSSNSLTGQIALNLPQLTFLFAYGNAFSGSIYPLVTTSLQFLNLHKNNFQGSILSATTTFPKNCSLRYFDLSHNKLSGELASSISNCNRLSWIRLGFNFLRGEIPSSLGVLSTSLLELSLQKNLLVGKIPSTLQNCIAMQVLDLSFNQLMGEIPRWITSLSALEVLLISHNQLEGTIPNNLTEDRTILQLLDLSENRLSGSMPASFEGLEAMKQNQMGWKDDGETDLHYGADVVMVSKGVELEFMYVLKVLAALTLSGNKLEGHLDEGIGTLQGLLFLNMSHNMLSGPIPSSVGNLAMLESLDLSHNRLEGLIPQSLSSLTDLADLNLSNNHLRGPIPTGGQLNTMGASSFYNNPDLCGLPTDHKCPPVSHHSHSSGTLAAWFSWLEEHVSLVGLALGHIGAFLITWLLLNRRLRRR